MVRSDRSSSSSRAARRAEALFATFVLGTIQNAAYTLSDLHRDLALTGIDISLGQLKRYSSQFDWQARRATLLDTLRPVDEDHLREAAMELQQRHASIGRGLISAGAAALQHLLSDPNRLTGMRPGEIARVLQLGVAVEDRAERAALDRRAIATEVWNGVIRAVAPIFLGVNEEPDPATRASAFAQRLDALIDEELVRLSKDDS